MTEAADRGRQGGYASQLEALRSVAKWLVAAFGAVGALLVAGLSISGIDKLSPYSWRLYVAGGSAALALAAVGFMLREASEVLAHEWLTLASFGDEQTGPTLSSANLDWRSARLREIDERLIVSSHELFGYAAESRAALQRRLRLADQRLGRARPGSRRAARWGREAESLRQAARDTVQYANYYYTLKLFQRMRIRLAWAALVVVVSVGAFAYSVNSPHDAPKAKAMAATTLSEASPKGLLLLARSALLVVRSGHRSVSSPSLEGCGSRRGTRRSREVLSGLSRRQPEVCPALAHRAPLGRTFRVPPAPSREEIP
jgi:hypothetical protein